jgi:ribosomal protein L37AE/L43A
MNDLDTFLAYINMQKIKTWLVLIVDGERSYGGNDGYEDVIDSTYRWDSNVPNYRAISEGDALIVWNKKELLGLAIVRDVFQKDSTKTRHRCPTCSRTKIKPRTTKTPVYRCEIKGCNSLFDSPKTEYIEVTEYVANYAGTWIPLRDSLDARGCRLLSSTPKSQLSIRPGNIDLISQFVQLQINIKNRIK